MNDAWRPTPTPITAHTILSSVAGLSAAWMVEMATRYFALQGSDINGALGVGIDTGSWLSTAYSVCEPIGVVIGAWLGIALSLRRMLLSWCRDIPDRDPHTAHRAEL